MYLSLFMALPASTAWLAVSFVIFVAWVLHQRYQSQLNQFPGPVLASISDIWRFGYSLYNRHDVPLAALHRKYGPVVRLGPRMLSFSTPEAIQDIYGPKNKLKKVCIWNLHLSAWNHMLIRG